MPHSRVWNRKKKKIMREGQANTIKGSTTKEKETREKIKNENACKHINTS